MRHHHRLNLHVLQAGLLHQFCSPLDGGIQLRSSAQPLTDVVGEVRERGVTVVIGHRGGDDLVGVGLVLRSQRSRLCRHRRNSLPRRTHLRDDHLRGHQRSSRY
jgi:hypothetical protein